MSSQKDKLEILSARIRKAEAEEKPKAESNRLRAPGYDFAGAVIGSVILGVLLDRFFGTGPWCLVVMVILGFATGILGVWKSMQRPESKE